MLDFLQHGGMEAAEGKRELLCPCSGADPFTPFPRVGGSCRTDAKIVSIFRKMPRGSESRVTFSSYCGTFCGDPGCCCICCLRCSSCWICSFNCSGEGMVVVPGPGCGCGLAGGIG